MFNNPKKYFLALIISLSIFSLKAQEADSLYYFSGQIVSKSAQYPVALAHVINIQRHRGVVADTMGYFRIWVKPGDTLNISAIGFDYFEYGINGFVKDSTVRIELQSRYYKIPEVSISYLGTYKQFEYKVVHLKLPDIGINDEVKKIFKHVDVDPVVVPSTSIFNPVSMIYSMFSKEAKDIHKYVELSKNQDIIDEARERFNPEIVHNLTGLEELEARAFMAFCDFKDEYIASISDYKLYNEILEKFEAYKKSKQDSLKSK